MRSKLILAPLLAWVLATGASVTSGGVSPSEPPLKLEVQLIWGTNDPQSPDPKHKPVESAVKKKLNELPLKWTNYFEVNRKAFEVPLSSTTKAPLSEKCALEVKNLGQSMIEVSLVGKGKDVAKRTQKLPKGETLVLGGNAPNATAWLVVLKRLE
ncbi:MAG: hypothetical protein QOJ40_2365 [Verrucomicrobiota bacterium]